MPVPTVSARGNCAPVSVRGGVQDWRRQTAIFSHALPESSMQPWQARARADSRVRILIDDFGTGYASRKYLKTLPINGLETDRLFVKDLPDSLADEAVVTAAVSLAGASGFQLVGEGIETRGQTATLREAGVPYLDGFLFSRALAGQTAPTLGAHAGGQWQHRAVVNRTDLLSAGRRSGVHRLWDGSQQMHGVRTTAGLCLKQQLDWGISR